MSITLQELKDLCEAYDSRYNGGIQHATDIFDFVVDSYVQMLPGLKVDKEYGH